MCMESYEVFFFWQNRDWVLLLFVIFMILLYCDQFNEIYHNMNYRNIYLRFDVFKTINAKNRITSKWKGQTSIDILLHIFCSYQNTCWDNTKKETSWYTFYEHDMFNHLTKWINSNVQLAAQSDVCAMCFSLNRTFIYYHMGFERIAKTVYSPQIWRIIEGNKKRGRK